MTSPFSTNNKGQREKQQLVALPTQIILVEICFSDADGDRSNSTSSSLDRHHHLLRPELVKRQLLDLQARSELFMEWEIPSDDSGDQIVGTRLEAEAPPPSSKTKNKKATLVRGRLFRRGKDAFHHPLFLESEHPLHLDKVPVTISWVYVPTSSSRITHYNINAVLTKETFVLLTKDQHHDLASVRLDVEKNHAQSTVDTLKNRMSRLFEQNLVRIGTAHGSLEQLRRAQQRSRALHEAFRLHFSTQQNDNVTSHSASLHLVTNSAPRQPAGSSTAKAAFLPRPPSASSLLERLEKNSGALIVHSPHRGSGKTELVKVIAKNLVGGDDHAFVHVIPGVGPLLAEHGIRADQALEEHLHSCVLRAAVGKRTADDEDDYPRVCIILDHLETFVVNSRNSRSGDAARPVIHSMTSYLKNLMRSIIEYKEFPFPTKEPLLYNLGATAGNVLQVRFCIVGITHLPEEASLVYDGLDGGDATYQTSPRRGKNVLQTFQDVTTSYRLPDLTAKDRLHSCEAALASVGTLTDGARRILPVLAASATSLRGAKFQQLAQHVQSTKGTRSHKGEKLIITEAVLKSSFVAVGRSSLEVSGSDVCFPTNESMNEEEELLFDSVGGNHAAKGALLEALAMNPRHRTALERFGLSPPTAVLLYGPPGNGKTLMARAVASILRKSTTSSNDRSSNDGACFLSLEATNIVQSEIGTSEKKLRSAFQVARANAPAVIFIDEFQALFTSRGRSAGSSSKLATTLLECLDDIAKWSSATSSSSSKSVANESAMGPKSNDRVVVMGATNAPWMIDKAFLRPGRFDRVVHVGLPNREDRQSILRTIIRDMQFDQSDRELTGEDGRRLCDMLGERTEGFSGADLAALCRLAAVKCLNDRLEKGIQMKIQSGHFLESLGAMEASASDELVERLRQWRP